jgi:hypothetical protein
MPAHCAAAVRRNASRRYIAWNTSTASSAAAPLTIVRTTGWTSSGWRARNGPMAASRSATHGPA